MPTPYREGPRVDLKCPRCAKQTLPPLDLAPCPKGCGTWVSAFAANIAFRDGELVENPLTRWWRVRSPCPICAEQMTLRGIEPALLQGCDLHGFWVDADTIEHTGLSRDDVEARLARMLDDPAAVEAERERLERLVLERARVREARDLKRAHEVRELERAEAERREAARAVLEGRYADIILGLQAGRIVPLLEELARLDVEVRTLKARVADLERRVT